MVQHGEWPDDLSGPVGIQSLHERDVEVVDMDNACVVTEGVVNVGKRLRPNRRSGTTVLFVTAGAIPFRYTAVKLT